MGWGRALEQAEQEPGITVRLDPCLDEESLVPLPAALAQLSRLPAMLLAQVVPGLLMLGGGH